MISSVFHFITNLLSVTDNPIVNFIIMAVIGYISFGIGWNAGSYGDNSVERKLFHWTFRIISFSVMYGITKYVCQLVLA